MVDKLLPLQNDRRLKEWVQQARASRGRGAMLGGDEGVIRLMQVGKGTMGQIDGHIQV